MLQESWSSHQESALVLIPVKLINSSTLARTQFIIYYVAHTRTRILILAYNGAQHTTHRILYKCRGPIIGKMRLRNWAYAFICEVGVEKDIIRLVLFLFHLRMRERERRNSKRTLALSSILKKMYFQLKNFLLFF